MSELFEYDGALYTKEQCDKKASEFFDPILLNQYPFVFEGMTVREYLEEKKYYLNHYKEVRNLTYKPLWKQKEAETGKA